MVIYMLNWHKSNIKYMAMNEREFKINVILSPPLLRQLTRRVWAIVSISLWPPLSFMLSHMLPDAMLYCENCEKQYREHPCGRNLALKWMKRLCESPDGKKPASPHQETSGAESSSSWCHQHFPTLWGGALLQILAFLFNSESIKTALTPLFHLLLPFCHSWVQHSFHPFAPKHLLLD